MSEEEEYYQEQYLTQSAIDQYRKFGELPPPTPGTSQESIAPDPSKEGGALSNDILTYIEKNESNEGGWQNDFDLAKKLLAEGHQKLALEFALLAREAQIKEGSQQETPAER